MDKYWSLNKIAVFVTSSQMSVSFQKLARLLYWCFSFINFWDKRNHYPRDVWRWIRLVNFNLLFSPKTQTEHEKLHINSKLDISVLALSSSLVIKTPCRGRCICTYNDGGFKRTGRPALYIIVWLSSFHKKVSFLQARSPVLIAAIFIAGIGGTFQYGFHISVLNSPSLVSTHVQL